MLTRRDAHLTLLGSEFREFRSQPRCIVDLNSFKESERLTSHAQLIYGVAILQE